MYSIESLASKHDLGAIMRLLYANIAYAQPYVHQRMSSKDMLLLFSYTNYSMYLSRQCSLEAKIQGHFNSLSIRNTSYNVDGILNLHK